MTEKVQKEKIVEMVPKGEEKVNYFFWSIVGALAALAIVGILWLVFSGPKSDSDQRADRHRNENVAGVIDSASESDEFLRMPVPEVALKPNRVSIILDGMETIRKGEEGYYQTRYTLIGGDYSVGRIQPDRNRRTSNPPVDTLAKRVDASDAKIAEVSASVGLVRQDLGNLGGTVNDLGNKVDQIGEGQLKILEILETRGAPQ